MAARRGRGGGLRLGCHHGLMPKARGCLRRARERCDDHDGGARGDADGGDGPQADVDRRPAVTPAPRDPGWRRCALRPSSLALVVFPDPDRRRAPLRAPAARSDLRRLPCRAHRARDRRGALGASASPSRTSALRLGDGGQIEFELQERARHRRDDEALAMAPSAPSVSLSRKALLSGRIAPESIDLVSPRLSLFYGEDGTLCAQVRHAGREPPGSERAKVPVAARDGRGAAAASAGAGRCRGRARPHRSRQGAVGGLRARPPARARQRLPARDRAQVGNRHHRQRRPQEHLAGAGARRRPRPSPQPQLDRRPGQDRVARRPLDARLPHLRARGRQRRCSWRCRCRAWCRAGLRARCPQLAGLEGFDVPVWAEAQLELSNTGEILSGTIDIDAAPGQRARCRGWRRRRCASTAGIWRSPTTAPRAASRSRPRCWCGATAACSSPARFAHTAEGAEGPRWAFDLQVGRRMDRRRAAACSRSCRSTTGRRAGSSRRSGAGSCSSEFRLRAGGAEVTRRGRCRRHGRRHAGAPRRQDRADAGRHLQDAVAGAGWRRAPRLGRHSGWCAAACRAAPSGWPSDASAGAARRWAAHGAARRAP